MARVMVQAKERAHVKALMWEIDHLRMLKEVILTDGARFRQCCEEHRRVGQEPIWGKPESHNTSVCALGRLHCKMVLEELQYSAVEREKESGLGTSKVITIMVLSPTFWVTFGK